MHRCGARSGVMWQTGATDRCTPGRGQRRVHTGRSGGMHSASQAEARMNKAVGAPADEKLRTRAAGANGNASDANGASDRAATATLERPSSAAADDWTIRARHRPPRILDVRDIREGQRAPEVLRRDTRGRRALAAADFAAAWMALAAGVIAGGHSLRPLAVLLPILMVLLCKL